MVRRLFKFAFFLGSLALLLLILLLDFVKAVPQLQTRLIDDFESGLTTGQTPEGNTINYYSWAHMESEIEIATTMLLPEPVPNSDLENHAIAMTLTVGLNQWAGFSHHFANEADDEWVSQDWQAYDGISFWMYGNGTNSLTFIDVHDNRRPDSMTDDAERWSYPITDDFTGWKLIEIPFSEFTRKEVGNGAPDDGFGRDEVWGYTIGLFGNVNIGDQIYYVDDVMLYQNTTTPTASATSTTTATVTSTATVTPTRTTTPTATVVATTVVTGTQTPTSTPTVTPTPTETATPFPTPTRCGLSPNNQLPICTFLTVITRSYFPGTVEMEPNDSRGQANGLIFSGVAYTGTMDSAADVNDYFSFRLFAPGTAVLSLTNIAAGHNYNLILRDEQLQVVPGGNSGNVGNAAEHIGPLTLPAGLYYIQIFNRGQTASTQPYRLVATFGP